MFIVCKRKNISLDFLTGRYFIGEKILQGEDIVSDSILHVQADNKQ